MKKIFISVAFLCFISINFVFSQSVSITPSGDEVLVTKYGGTPNLVGMRAAGTAAAPTATGSGAGLVSFGGRGYTGSLFTDSKVQIIMATDELFSPTANGTRINFSTTLNGTDILTERMRIDNAGNVGIGTISPLKLLHLAQGSSGVTPFIYSKLFIEGNTNTYLQLGSPENDENGVVFGKPSANYGSIVYNAINSLRFTTNGSSTRLTILNDGNVGIGTTTPDTKLHVEGSENTGTTAALKITNGTSHMLLDGNEIDVMNDGDLLLNKNSGGSVILADGGGRVYVGANGTGLFEIIKATVSIPFFTANPGACYTHTVSVANATINSVVSVSPDAALATGLVIAYARVPSAGNVDIRICNFQFAGPLNQSTIDYHLSIIR